MDGRAGRVGGVGWIVGRGGVDGRVGRVGGVGWMVGRGVWVGWGG